MKKKIVFVINYFYPDFAATGQLMTELCLELQHHFDITVIAAVSENHQLTAKSVFQNDELEGIKIVRIKLPEMNKRSKWSRIKYICLYFILALTALLKQNKTDLIFTISTPPIIGGLIGTCGKFFKKSKHIYNIQDFNPEQAEAVNYLKRKWIFQFARRIDNMNCKYADHVITVGKDMQQTLISRLQGIHVPQHSVINNWTDERDIVPLPKDHPEVSQFIQNNDLLNKFVVMYSGNLGLYYDLENIIKVTNHFKNNPDVIFLFIGDGVVKPSMEHYIEEHQIHNVKFLPLQPKETIKYSLNAADVHLVVNQKGIKGVSVPSKIYGVMAVGKPILGVLESGSEAEGIITSSECGVVVHPHNYEEIIKSIELFVQTPTSKRLDIGNRGRKYLEKHFEKRQSIRKYQEVFMKT